MSAVQIVSAADAMGVIDLSTFTTTRFKTDFEPAHGMVYDAFTGLMTLFGDGFTGTFDPNSATPESTLLQSAQLNGDFDQGAVDGKGHALIAGANSITFVHYSVSHDITEADYVHVFGGFANIDDVAPLSGLGSIDTGVPDSAPVALSLALLLPILGDYFRRRASRA